MKEGIAVLTRRLLLAVVATLALSLSGALALPKAWAYAPLDLVRDYTASNVSGQIDIGHDIYFVLPTTAQQVTPTDWILITFTDYQSIRATNASVIGGFGTPIFDVVGKTVRITNLALVPGGALEVIGIIANNPPANGSQTITISVAEDSGGAVIRNQSITVPIEQGGYVTVSANVQSILSTLTVSGYTAGSAFTTLTENGAVIGTTVADGTGYFLFAINALPPGAHSYNVFSTDSQNRSTSVSTLSLFLLAGSTTNVTGILLSPSLVLDKTEINAGDTITATGSAKPNSQINLFLEAPLRSYTTSTDNNGTWSYTIPQSETTTFTPGQYRVYANVQDALANQSIASPTSNFTVKNAADTTNPPPNCDISHGDLNCDGKTNLVDFSILLFHWQTNHRVADINADGKVNLVDFSIMMFYFNR